MTLARRKPPWLKVKAPLCETYSEVKKILGGLSLHTVCQEANCPNRMECWSQKTATFLILGDVCTRGCSFCDVSRGKPGEVDRGEPGRVAEAVDRMELEYVVVTSVTRDDLPDGGASIFADTVRALKDIRQSIGVEVLIPDFRGSKESLMEVIESAPDVINHNLETTRRLTPVIRKGADYDRSLELLRRVSEWGGNIRSKSGLMLGLGETTDELKRTFADLAEASCELLTIGQYLSPSERHHPVERFYTPEEFDGLRESALTFGFSSVLAGPLIRSSYHAREQTNGVTSRETMQDRFLRDVPTS
ncbi:MAG: lipoyl synthase [Candidatus Zixiibacteriota bacterium]